MLNDVYNEIKRSFNALWQMRVRGHSIEVVTPVTTSTGVFVSVFITMRGNQYVVTDGAWVHTGMYDCDIPLADPIFDKIYSFYKEEYRVNDVFSNDRTFYFKKTERFELVPNLVFDLSNFIRAIVSDGVIKFKTEKENETRRRFSDEANSFIKRLNSTSIRVRLNEPISENAPLLKFNAILEHNKTLSLVNFVYGNNESSFYDTIARMNLGFDYIEASLIRQNIKNKIGLIDEYNDIYRSPNVDKLLKSVLDKDGRKALLWRQRERISELIN